ncbi:hypothetical protein LSAT2_023142, partial [Lamellibrachia satsuma]
PVSSVFALQCTQPFHCLGLRQHTRPSVIITRRRPRTSFETDTAASGVGCPRGPPTSETRSVAAHTTPDRCVLPNQHRGVTSCRCCYLH